MTSTGDILRFTVSGEYLGQQVVNVFFYMVSSGSNGFLSPIDFVPDWAAEFELKVVAGLSDKLIYDRVVFDNLTNGLDFADTPINVSGSIALAHMPSSVAIPVTLKRSSKVTRNGSKRYAGVLEDKTDGNVLSLDGQHKSDIESFHGDTVVLLDYDGQGNQLNLQNVVIGRTKDVNGVYQLDLSKINPIYEAQVGANVSTQNSRKP